MAKVERPPGECAYWVTREADDEGHLDDLCQYWTAQPELVAHPYTKAVYWIGEWCADTKWGRCTVADTLKWCGTYPQTARECIKVERWGGHAGKPDAKPVDGAARAA